MLPDIRTLAMLLAVTSLVSALTLYLFYRLLPEVPGLKQAAIAGICQAIGSTFLFIRDFIDPMLSIMVSNGAYFVAYTFYYQAARLFCGRAAEWRWPGLIIVVLYPLLMLLPGKEYLDERIIINSLVLGSLTLMTSWILWKDEAELPGRRGLAVTFAFIAVISASRIISRLSNPLEGVAFLDFNAGFMIFIWAIIASIAITAGVIVMTSERLREQLNLQLSEVTVAHNIAHNALREQKNFLAMLSHEFKTPLSIIKANADAVATIENPPPSFIKDSLTRIQKTSLRLNSLVDGCLNNEWVSHMIEKNESSLATLNLTELLTDLCREYDIRFIDQGSPAGTHLQGDRYLLPILFSSLIDNARKYAYHQDSVEVSLLHTADGVTVKIFDDGPGIAEQERDRVFDKYYRGECQKHQSGSGLGLFFAKRIVEQHGGSIFVECQQGTTFTITLPASENH